MSIKYLTVEETLEMHGDLIEEFGGLHGVRDLGALESALMRPQMGYYDGILEEAAAMLESLAINHPFIDGNKRVAFAATEGFLRLNGYRIVCDDIEAYRFFMRLFKTNSFRYAALLEWLEEVAAPLEEGSD